MENEQVLGRAAVIEAVLLDLQKAGAEYTLGLVENDQALYNRVFLGISAIYVLERMLFMDSFANTFGIVELGYFQGAGALVQKIMNDECYMHCKVWEYVLKHEMSTRRGATAFAMCRDKIETMLEEALAKEYSWNSYAFSGNKRVVGYNELLANEWANWNAQEVYLLFGILPKFDMLVQNPLPFMDKWLDIDLIQNAQQEGDGTNYLLNSFINDITEEDVFVFEMPNV
jgi:ribonucleoside-diphosphate reductase beta chain